MLSGSLDSTLKIWDAATGARLHSALSPCQSIGSSAERSHSRLSWSHGDVSSSMDLTAPSVAGVEKRTLSGHSLRVQSCRWVTSDLLISSSLDGTTRWWTKQQGGGFASVATFYFSSPAAALGVRHGCKGEQTNGMAVVGSQQGAVLILKFDPAKGFVMRTDTHDDTRSRARRRPAECSSAVRVALSAGVAEPC